MQDKLIRKANRKKAVIKTDTEELLGKNELFHQFFNSEEMFQVLELIRDKNGKAIDYYYREVNPAFERLVGKPRAQLIGKRAKDLFGIVEDEWIEAYDKVVKSGIPAHFENYGAELDKYYVAFIWKLTDLQVAVIFTELVKIKQVEKALRESEARFRLSLQNSAVNVSSQDLALRYTWQYNPQLGYSVQDVIGKTDTELLPPDTASQVIALKTKAIATEKQVREEVSLINNNKTLYYDFTVEPLRDHQGSITGVMNIVIDITERKKVEEEVLKLMASIQLEKDRLSTLVNSIPDEVWFSDMNKNFTLANPSALHEFGIESANNKIGVESLAVSLEVYRPDGSLRPVDEAPPLRALKGEIVRNQEEIIRTPATGELRHRQVSASPVKDANGNIIGSVSVVRDITDLKKAEEELKRYTAELEAANKELESFSYSISHDLRTPLRTLDGFSEMVIMEYGDKLDETAKNYLNRIRKAGQTMSQLTEDILKLSRITRAEMHKEKVNLSEMAGSIAAELKAAQPERQAEYIIAPGITVGGDKSLLHILLQNLLENSWKYTSKCPDTRIEVGVVNQSEERVYFIKDNGIGFDMKYYDKLFQPFQRLHTNKDYPGTGIGLATAQRVIRRHGGQIWAESEIGKGTTFYFTLE